MSLTSSASALDARAFVSNTLVAVFDTTLGLRAIPVSSLPPPSNEQGAERVTGCVGIGGEGIRGALYIHLPTALARHLAAGLLDVSREEITGDSEANDLVGELCNMVTGNLKSRLCNAGIPCALSMPTVIRGTAFEIQPEPGARHEVLLFTCNDEPITVEVYLKFK